jgi:YesN/AraC family two-component response regulator
VPLSGALSISVGETRLEANRNQVIYIPPLHNHSFCARGPNQFLVFDIPKLFFANENTEFKTKYAVDKQWEAIRTLVSSEIEAGKPKANQRIADLSRYIIGLLEKQTSFASLDYIHQHYSTKTSMQELADMEHYNETYYCEWFKKQVGQSPMEYIRTLRVEKAKMMLCDTRYSIQQIAYEVGYENQATLSKLFRSHLGMSPTEFRSKHRNTNK